jgi:hypothetical protein
MFRRPDSVAECYSLSPIIHRPTFRRLDSLSVLRWTYSGRRQRLSLSIGPNWAGSTWRHRQNLVSETLCFEVKQKTGRWIMSRIVIDVLYFVTSTNWTVPLLICGSFRRKNSIFPTDLTRFQLPQDDAVKAWCWKVHLSLCLRVIN